MNIIYQKFISIAKRIVYWKPSGKYGRIVNKSFVTFECSGIKFVAFIISKISLKFCIRNTSHLSSIIISIDERNQRSLSLSSSAPVTVLNPKGEPKMNKKENRIDIPMIISESLKEVKSLMFLEWTYNPIRK